MFNEYLLWQENQKTNIVYRDFFFRNTSFLQQKKTGQAYIKELGKWGLKIFFFKKKSLLVFKMQGLKFANYAKL